MTHNINYQRIFEEELNHVVRENAGMGDRFFELTNSQRMFVESLIDIAYEQAVSDALDPEVLNETADLAGEMGTQLYNFANMLQVYLNSSDEQKSD